MLSSSWHAYPVSENPQNPNASAPFPFDQDDASLTVHRMAAHDRLSHQSRVVLRLGQMLLSAGAGSYRVKASMRTCAEAVGIEKHHAQVTFTEIVATAYANGTFRTELAEQRLLGVNADKIDRITNYLASIEGKQALASGLACAAFSFLNAGGWVECSVVAIAAFFGQFLRRQMLKRHMNHFGVWMLCGAVASAIYILCVYMAQRYLGIEPTHQAGFISALLFLVPGFPLVTGIIDLVRHDFAGGIQRIVYVAMLVVSAGVAVWTISEVFNWSVTPQYIVELPPIIHFALRFFTSFVAAYGFAMLFNSPPKVCTAAALIGATINTGRIFLAVVLGVPVPAAVGLAALAAGLLAAAVANRTRFSRVTLSVPAVVIMIPGVPLYRSLTYLNNGQTMDALAQLFTVLFTIVAIGIGLAISRMLTDRAWLMEKPVSVPKLEECDAA